MKILSLVLLPVILFCSSCAERGSEKMSILVGKSDTTQLVEPFGMCADRDGNLYVADVGRNAILKVDQKGTVSIYAGTGALGSKDGILKEASFSGPSGVCFDKNGTMYVAGFGGQNIRKITKEGMVTTLAGTGEEGYLDGAADVAKFSSPRGLCVDSKGNVFVADCWNHRIRKITPDGMVCTFAGGGTRGELVVNDCKDGRDTTARFEAPCGMSIDKEDNLYVADANNHCIRKITPDGFVTTIAGIGKQKGFVDGPLGKSLLNVPTELFVTDDHEIYFSDTYNHCVRKIDKDGNVITLVGTGKDGLAEDADPKKAMLGSPRGICLNEGKLYFVEWKNHTLRRID